jgi:HEAT repeat protein
MIRFSCLNCATRLKIAPGYIGKHVKCSQCGLSVPVPTELVQPSLANDPLARSPSPGDAAPAAGGGPAKRWGKKKTYWVAGLSISALLVLVLFLGLLFFSPNEIDQKLKDLKGGDTDQSKQALQWLADADRQDTDRPKVTAALEPLVFDGDIHHNLDPDLVLRVYLLWVAKDNVPAMIRMVQSPTLPSWSQQKTALVMDALGKLHDERASAVLAGKLADPALHDQAVNALRLLGPKAEPAVLEYVFADDPATRLRASQLLADYGTKSKTIAAEARNRLRSQQPEVQHSAIVWFVDNAPTEEVTKVEVAKLLGKLLDSTSPETSKQVLQALKLWATKDCLAQLVEYARGAQKNAAGDPMLIEVLAQFQTESAAEAVAWQLLNSPMRDKAAKALLKLGPVATKAVLEYIDHPDVDVHKEARSLSNLLKIPVERQLDQIRADLADPWVPRSSTALKHLASLRPDESNRLKVSKALNAPLLDANAAIADIALDAVAVWRSKENTDTLLKMLGSFNKSAMKRNVHIIKILGELKDPKAVPVLVQGLAHDHVRRDVAKALKAIGPEAEDAVIPFVQSVDKEIRLTACRILRDIGTDKSVQPLNVAYKMYSQVDGEFAQEAVIALQMIAARK